MFIRYEEGTFVEYRHYDLLNAPEHLFSFGFGLSYTNFEVRSTSIAAPEILSGVDGKITVSTLVVNTGACVGKMVLQFYVQSPTLVGLVLPSVGNILSESNSARPIKELKAFEKVLLQPGESRNVSVELDRYAVSCYNETGTCWQVLRGTYKLLVGFSAAEIVGEVEFRVEDDFTWNGIYWNGLRGIEAEI
jgi:beta-glucosidase